MVILGEGQWWYRWGLNNSFTGICAVRYLCTPVFHHSPWFITFLLLHSTPILAWANPGSLDPGANQVASWRFAVALASWASKIPTTRTWGVGGPWLAWLASGRQTWQWTMADLWMIFPWIPPLIGDFPLPIAIRLTSGWYFYLDNDDEIWDESCFKYDYILRFGMTIHRRTSLTLATRLRYPETTSLQDLETVNVHQLAVLWC